jgi:PTH2 family peptidyl-tRNA hydrolase
MSEEIKQDLVIYFVVRKSLNMSIGKTAAQVAHAMSYISNNYMSYQWMCEDDVNVLTDGTTLEQMAPLVKSYNDFKNSDSHTKIVLGAADDQFEKLKEEFKSSIQMVLVKDIGKTEVEPGSETVLGFFPINKSEASANIRSLPTLK